MNLIRYGLMGVALSLLGSFAFADADRVMTRLDGVLFQTHYPSFATPGRSCKAMKKFFDNETAPAFNDNPQVKEQGIRIGWNECRKVENTLTRGSFLEMQLEMAPYLVGPCPRSDIAFFTNTSLDSIQDINDRYHPFLHSLGFVIELVPAVHFMGMTITNQMRVTVPGCNALGYSTR